MSDEFDSMKGLVPKVIEGRDPGSVYQVALRSVEGYVAVRRLAEDAFRVRCERFDKKSLAEGLPDDLKRMAAAARVQVADLEGTRISGVVIGRASLSRAIAVLGMILAYHDVNFAELPIQLDEKIAAFAQHAKECLNCAKAHMLTPTETPPGEALTTMVGGAHDDNLN